MKIFLLTFLALSCFAPPKEAIRVSTNELPHPEFKIPLLELRPETPIDFPNYSTNLISPNGHIAQKIEEMVQIFSYLTEEIKQYIRENLRQLSDYKFPSNTSLKVKMVNCETLGKHVAEYGTPVSNISAKAGIQVSSADLDIFAKKLAALVDEIITRNDPQNATILTQQRQIGTLTTNYNYVVQKMERMQVKLNELKYQENL